MAKRSWILRLSLAVLWWILPVGALWWAITPLYNHFLTVGGEVLVRATESPAVTRLQSHDNHHLVITRSDFPKSRGALTSIRTTDIHFHLVLLGALFLAVPDVKWGQRLSNLGLALLIAVLFHLVSMLFQVKFVYATQLGSWSAANYSAFGQNFWGLGKHLLDLPFKLALPLLLWAPFYLLHLRTRP